MAKMKRIKSIQLLSLLLVFGLFSACEGDITFNGLPQPVQGLISQNYSSSTITRIEREYDEPYCYEVYLSNGVELYFDCDGALLYARSYSLCIFFFGCSQGIRIYACYVLFAQYLARKCDHVGNINAERAVAASAQHTIMPDKVGHFMQVLPFPRGIKQQQPTPTPTR